MMLMDLIDTLLNMTVFGFFGFLLWLYFIETEDN